MHKVFLHTLLGLLGFEFFCLLRTVLGIISFHYYTYHHRSYLDYAITVFIYLIFIYLITLGSLQPQVFLVLPCSYYRLKKMKYRSP